MEIQNQETTELCKTPDLTADIKRSLKWLEHVIRIESSKGDYKIVKQARTYRLRCQERQM
jgi:hypothetical protein